VIIGGHEHCAVGAGDDTANVAHRFRLGSAANLVGRAWPCNDVPDVVTVADVAVKSRFPANREFYKEDFLFLLRFTVAANESARMLKQLRPIPCSTKTGAHEVFLFV